MWFIVQWWRHQMETFSASMALCEGNSPFTGEFPSQRTVTRSFDVFFYPALNNQLSKQSTRRWSEAPSCPLWYIMTSLQWCRVDSFVNIKALLLSAAMWRHRFRPTLAQVMACCLMAPSHYLDQSWHIIKCALWYSTDCNFTRKAREHNLEYLLGDCTFQLSPHLPGAMNMIQL